MGELSVTVCLFGEGETRKVCLKRDLAVSAAIPLIAEAFGVRHSGSLRLLKRGISLNMSRSLKEQKASQGELILHPGKGAFVFKQRVDEDTSGPSLGSQGKRYRADKEEVEESIPETPFPLCSKVRAIQPIGTFSLSLLSDCLVLIGESEKFNVPFANLHQISKVPHAEEDGDWVIMGLKQPLFNSEAESIHSLILSLGKENFILNLSESSAEVQALADGSLSLTGPKCLLLAQLLSQLAETELLQPLPHSRPISFADGLIYQLKKGLLLVPASRPFIAFEDMESIVLEESTSDSLDVSLELMDGNLVQFSGIPAEEQKMVTAFAREHGINVRRVSGPAAERELSFSSQMNVHEIFYQLKEEGNPKTALETLSQLLRDENGDRSWLALVKRLVEWVPFTRIFSAMKESLSPDTLNEFLIVAHGWSMSGRNFACLKRLAVSCLPASEMSSLPLHPAEVARLLLTAGRVQDLITFIQELGLEWQEIWAQGWPFVGSSMVETLLLFLLNSSKATDALVESLSVPSINVTVDWGSIVPKLYFNGHLFYALQLAEDKGIVFDPLSSSSIILKPFKRQKPRAKAVAAKSVRPAETQVPVSPKSPRCPQEAKSRVRPPLNFLDCCPLIRGEARRIREEVSNRAPPIIPSSKKPIWEEEAPMKWDSQSLLAAFKEWEKSLLSLSAKFALRTAAIYLGAAVSPLEVLPLLREYRRGSFYSEDAYLRCQSLGLAEEAAILLAPLLGPVTKTQLSPEPVQPPQTPQPQTRSYLVRALGKTLAVVGTAVEELVAAAATDIGCSESEVRLSYEGKQLPPEGSLEELGILPGATLVSSLRLRGGANTRQIPEEAFWPEIGASQPPPKMSQNFSVLFHIGDIRTVNLSFKTDEAGKPTCAVGDASNDKLVCVGKSGITDALGKWVGPNSWAAAVGALPSGSLPMNEGDVLITEPQRIQGGPEFPPVNLLHGLAPQNIPDTQALKLLYRNIGKSIKAFGWEEVALPLYGCGVYGFKSHNYVAHKLAWQTLAQELQGSTSLKKLVFVLWNQRDCMEWKRAFSSGLEAPSTSSMNVPDSDPDPERVAIRRVLVQKSSTVSLDLACMNKAALDSFTKDTKALWDELRAKLKGNPMGVRGAQPDTMNPEPDEAYPDGTVFYRRRLSGPAVSGLIPAIKRLRSARGIDVRVDVQEIFLCQDKGDFDPLFPCPEVTEWESESDSCWDSDYEEEGDAESLRQKVRGLSVSDAEDDSEYFSARSFFSASDRLTGGSDAPESFLSSAYAQKMWTSLLMKIEDGEKRRLLKLSSVQIANIANIPSDLSVEQPKMASETQVAYLPKEVSVGLGFESYAVGPPSGTDRAAFNSLLSVLKNHFGLNVRDERRRGKRDGTSSATPSSSRAPSATPSPSRSVFTTPVASSSNAPKARRLQAGVSGGKSSPQAPSADPAAQMRQCLALLPNEGDLWDDAALKNSDKMDTDFFMNSERLQRAFASLGDDFPASLDTCIKTTARMAGARSIFSRPMDNSDVILLSLQSGGFVAMIPSNIGIWWGKGANEAAAVQSLRGNIEGSPLIRFPSAPGAPSNPRPQPKSQRHPGPKNFYAQMPQPRTPSAPKPSEAEAPPRAPKATPGPAPKKVAPLANKTTKHWERMVAAGKAKREMMERKEKEDAARAQGPPKKKTKAPPPPAKSAPKGPPPKAPPDPVEQEMEVEPPQQIPPTPEKSVAPRDKSPPKETNPDDDSSDGVQASNLTRVAPKLGDLDQLLQYSHSNGKFQFWIHGQDAASLGRGSMLTEVIIDWFLDKRARLQSDHLTALSCNLVKGMLLARHGGSEEATPPQLLSLAVNQKQRTKIVKMWGKYHSEALHPQQAYLSHGSCFDKKLILIPFHSSCHWYILAVLHPSSESPCAFFLNSVPTHMPLRDEESLNRLTKKAQILLSILYLAEHPDCDGIPESVSKIDITHLSEQIPFQAGGVDCGIFSLFYSLALMRVLSRLGPGQCSHSELFRHWKLVEKEGQEPCPPDAEPEEDIDKDIDSIVSRFSHSQVLRFRRLILLSLAADIENPSLKAKLQSVFDSFEDRDQDSDSDEEAQLMEAIRRAQEEEEEPMDVIEDEPMDAEDADRRETMNLMTPYNRTPSSTESPRRRRDIDREEPPPGFDLEESSGPRRVSVPPGMIPLFMHKTDARYFTPILARRVQEARRNEEYADINDDGADDGDGGEADRGAEDGAGAGAGGSQAGRGQGGGAGTRQKQSRPKVPKKEKAPKGLPSAASVRAKRRAASGAGNLRQTAANPLKRPSSYTTNYYWTLAATGIKDGHRHNRLSQSLRSLSFANVSEAGHLALCGALQKGVLRLLSLLKATSGPAEKRGGEQPLGSLGNSVQAFAHQSPNSEPSGAAPQTRQLDFYGPQLHVIEQAEAVTLALRTIKFVKGKEILVRALNSAAAKWLEFILPGSFLRNEDKTDYNAASNTSLAFLRNDTYGKFS